MGIFGLKRKDGEKNPKTHVQPGAPVFIKEKPVASTVKPRLGLAVTDEHPTLSTRLTFERQLRDTNFKCIASEATITNIKSYQGYAVEASRTAGRFTTKALHDFGSGDTRVDLGLEEKRKGRRFTANYVASIHKPKGGIIDITAKSGSNKLAASHLLSKGLSALTLTHEELRGDGLYTALAAVNSDQAVRLALSKKVVKNDSVDTYTLSCVLPYLASASWKHDSITISATAPVMPSGVGAAKIVMLWEPAFAV